jgi:branched-chain amino acid transport system permease protein
VTTVAAAGPRRRPSLGRWRGATYLVVTVVAAYLLIYLGVIFEANNLHQQMSLQDALSQSEQQFVNALTIGAVYALIALGYTMVYGIIELINFAHGEIFMCGSFVSWWLLTTLGFSGAINDPIQLGIVLALAFLVSMVVMGVVGVVIERLAYRRLRNAPRLAPLITAIGVSFILH